MSRSRSIKRKILYLFLFVPLLGGIIDVLGALVVTLYRLIDNPKLLESVRFLEFIWLPAVIPFATLIIYSIPSVVLAFFAGYGGFVSRPRDCCIVGVLGGALAYLWSWIVLSLISNGRDLFSIDLLGIFGCGALASYLVAKFILPHEIDKNALGKKP